MKISYRQISILVFFLLIAFKVLSLPCLLYLDCKQNGYIVMLVVMLIDMGILFASLKVLEQSDSKNIYEFLKSYIGGFWAKILVIGLTVLPFIRIVVKSKGLEWFLGENLYTQFEWFQYAIPMGIVMIYMIYKGIRNIARVCEFFVWIIIGGVVIIVIKGVGSMDKTFFLPFASEGIAPLLKGAFNHIHFFGIGGEILLLAGDIDFSNKTRRTMVKGCIIAIVLVQFVVWVYYGVFGQMSPVHNFAISDISQVSNSSVSLDELSWLIVSLWAVAQMLQLALYGYMLCKGFRMIFNTSNIILPTFLLLVAFLIWVYLAENTVSLEANFLSAWLVWYCIVWQYIIPLIIFGISFIKKKGENNEKQSKTKQHNAKKSKRSQQKEYA